MGVNSIFKRLLAFLLATLLSISLFAGVGRPVNAADSDIWASGYCDEEKKMFWELTYDGTLTISGVGELYDYQYGYSYAPWLDYRHSLKKVVIKEGITKIGQDSFYDENNIESVSLPESLKIIGVSAFKRCNSLKEIKLPAGLTEIGDGAFDGCNSLESITIPAGVKVIPANTFNMCSKLKEVNLSEGLEAIGGHAFMNCALETIEFPDTVTSIGGYAFQNCNFTSVTIPDGIKVVNEYLFYSCLKLNEVKLPNGITRIETAAFGSCVALKEITLPESLSVIEKEAFYLCRSLDKMTIPSGVIELGTRAFWNCAALREITFTGSPPAFAEDAFQYYSGCIRYPADNPAWTNDVMQSYGGNVVWVDDKHVHQYEEVIIAPNCTEKGYTSHICASCGFCFNDTYVSALNHDMAAATCTSPQTCRREGCGYTYGYPLSHQWDDPMIAPRTCLLCGAVDEHEHQFKSTKRNRTCTAQGYTTHTCVVCGYSYQDGYEEPLGHIWADATCSSPRKCQREECGRVEGSSLGHTWIDDSAEFKECSVCGFILGGYRIQLNTEEVGTANSFWIDGVEYPLKRRDNICYVDLPYAAARSLVIYTYNDPNAADVHTQYPTGMKVWMLDFIYGGYTTKYIPEFDDLLQYSGSSIRITGKKGIRMITSITKNNKEALTGKGLAGYTLVEYGTVLAWASDLDSNKPLLLRESYTKSNYAYKKDVADPVYKDTGKLIQYTNVLVGFNDDQCIPDIAMRPYIILRDANNVQITIYGGVIYRSIGYIAYQNRNAFKPGTGSYNYVWGIIHHVYGDKYDKDYKG